MEGKELSSDEQKLIDEHRKLQAQRATVFELKVPEGGAPLPVGASQQKTVEDVEMYPQEAAIEEHRKLQAQRAGAPAEPFFDHITKPGGLDEQLAEGNSEELNPHEAAPPSKDPIEPRKAIPHELGHRPSRDEDLQDSVGNPKTEHPGSDSAKESHAPITEAPLVGPRGANVSPEHMTELQKAESAEKQRQREQRGMSSTAAVDSRGDSKHVYRHEIQGYDKHGARIPDKRTDEVLEEAPPHVGPRGKGAPKETFHRK